MNDKKFVIIGIIVFLIIVTSPLWFQWVWGKPGPAPEPVLADKAKAAKECVRSKDYMTRQHMKLLDFWRYEVVRKAERIYVNPSGKEFTMSLSNTCLDCHSNKTEFCDRCHNYASVRPYCWDCHIDNPKESK
jgi:hypothetical protein